MLSVCLLCFVCFVLLFVLFYFNFFICSYRDKKKNMVDLRDMPELVDNCDIYEDTATVDLKGDGLNLEELRQGKETTFEVDLSSVSPDSGKYDYFDGEEKFKQLNYDCIDEGNNSEDERLTPFVRIKQDMEDLSGDGGVVKKIINHGAGSVVSRRSLCRVHYNAYLEYSDEPFDSSRLRGKQHQFKLGAGEVLKGWEIGVATMKRGELARFMFGYQYAYGKMGCPPRIPKEAAVLFEIELISFVDQVASDEFENFSEEERKKTSLDEILKVAESLRMTGNEAFNLKQIGRAAGKYSQALRLLENTNLSDEAEENLMKKSALKLYLNLCLCNMKQARYGRSCKYARKALDVDSKNVKALFRLGQSLRKMSDYEEAKKQITKARRLSPDNGDILKELHVLDADIKKSSRENKELFQKMLNINSIAKEKKAPEPKVSSQMTNMVSDRLKAFVDENEMQRLNLPNLMTDEEMISIVKVVKDMNLHLYVSGEGNEKSIHVSKVANK